MIRNILFVLSVFALLIFTGMGLWNVTQIASWRELESQDYMLLVISFTMFSTLLKRD